MMIRMPPVTEQEYHTIIAALRCYQYEGQGDPSWHDLATNHGDVTSLDDAGIDELVEQLNLGASILTDPLQQYVAVSGWHCPECSSTEIEAQRPECEGLEVYVEVACNTCGACWAEFYELRDILFHERD